MDAVELFESRKVWLRLIQRGHGAGDDHGVRMAALTGQHRHSADGLKDQIYRAGGQIGGGDHRSWQRSCWGPAWRQGPGQCR